MSSVGMNLLDSIQKDCVSISTNIEHRENPTSSEMPSVLDDIRTVGKIYKNMKEVTFLFVRAWIYTRNVTSFRDVSS